MAWVIFTVLFKNTQSPLNIGKTSKADFYWRFCPTYVMELFVKIVNQFNRQLYS